MCTYWRFTRNLSTFDLQERFVQKVEEGRIEGFLIFVRKSSFKSYVKGIFLLLHFWNLPVSMNYQRFGVIIFNSKLNGKGTFL